MAIRIGQDLGLHKSPDSLTSLTGLPLFSNDQRVVRKRLWYGCVMADRYLSMYLGRPLAIRESDWDVHLLDEINGQTEENLLWKCHTTQNSSGFYTAAPTRLISCINANVSLFVVIGNILERLYTTKADSVSYKAADLIQQLNDWRESVPSHIKVTDHNTMFKATPNILSLHMGYWCAVILLYRPFLSATEHASAESGEDKIFAWDHCLTAAQQLVETAKAWNVNFLFKHASPFFVYDVFQAGLIWVAAITFRPMEMHFLTNLDFCLETLGEMRTSHVSAVRCYELLQGTVASQQISTSASSTAVAKDDTDEQRYTLDGSSLYAFPGMTMGQPLLDDYLGGEMTGRHDHSDFLGAAL